MQLRTDRDVTCDATQPMFEKKREGTEEPYRHLANKNNDLIRDNALHLKKQKKIV